MKASSNLDFRTDDFLKSLLWDNATDAERNILSHPKEYHLQIIYVQINRNSDNNPSFKEYNFHVNPNHYFYPASTVKLPIALAALEKIQQLNLPELTKYTPMFTANLPGATPEVTEDCTAPDRKPSIAHYLKKIFLVSDNDAANRLYEFTGQQPLNRSLHSKGYTRTDILHRLDISLPPEQNRRTNGISFIKDGKIIYAQPEIYNADPYPIRHDFIAEKHFSDGKMIETVSDFSLKNRAPLKDILQILQSVLFPEYFSEEKRFLLSDDDYNFLYRYLSAFPAECDSPHYDAREFPPTYVKFLMPLKEDSRQPFPYIRSFSKSGWAYGFLSDVAYIVDFQHQVEFMLAATLRVKDESTQNKEEYDYEKTGKPFLRKIGHIIYQYELTRPGEYLPDLTRYSFSYG